MTSLSSLRGALAPKQSLKGMGLPDKLEGGEVDKDDNEGGDMSLIISTST